MRKIKYKKNLVNALNIFFAVFKLISVANCQASSCFSSQIQNILATLQIVCSSARITSLWVQSNFVGWFRNGFAAEPKLELSSLGQDFFHRCVFRYQDRCYISNNTVLLCTLLYKRKQILNYFQLLSLFSLIQILRGQTLIFSSCTQRFYSKVVVVLQALQQKKILFPHRLPFQNSLMNG